MALSVRSRTVLSLAAPALLGLAWFAAPARSEDAPSDEAAPAVEKGALLDPREHRIGRLIPDLAFKDLDGKAGKLSGMMGENGLIIAVRSVGCPLSKKYAPTLKRLHDTWSSRGFGLLFINPCEGDTVADMQGEVKAYGFKSRYAADPGAKIAAALGAFRTTDVFVLDAGRTLVYRGAIDDQYGIGYARNAPSETWLNDALTAIAGGRRVEVPATSAPGCELPIKAAAPSAGAVTWHNRISRIVQQNCQECHREGESGPFELMTYKDVKSSRAMIERVVGNRTMPPWFADPKHGQWKNDRSLSDRDREDLLAWIKADCPKGDPADAPKPMSFVTGWHLGRPDAILRMPRPIQVPAEGVVNYKYITVPTRFSEDKWVSAVEVRASAPEVVHHVLVFVKYPKDHPRAKDQPRFKGGLKGYFAGLVPGQNFLRFPKGTAKFLPKGAILVFQLHYTTCGRAVTDQTKLGLHFTTTPERELRTLGIYNTRFRIPPGDGSHTVLADRRLRTPTRIFGFSPHMHLRGKAFRYDAVLPDGTTRTLLNVPRFDFNWQLFYQLREPVDLPAGTVIKCEAVFDNSADNPANPNPKKTVRFGEQTWEEMMIGYYNAVELNESLRPKSAPKPAAPKAADPKPDAPKKRKRPVF